MFLSKKILLPWLLIFAAYAHAESLKVVPSTQQPLVGEVFNLVFIIDTNSSSEPYITFDPGGATIIGRQSQGISTQTTIINGRFSTKRTMRYAYEVVSDRARTLRISKINVEIDGKKLKHPDVTINVLKTAKAKPDYFVLAEPEKTEVYLGEGINVSYYLYSKRNVVGYELEKFPVFNGFIKRFNTKPNETPERVNYQGDVYIRSKKYEARVYPEKTGNLKIDPIRLKIQYADRMNRNPFRNFGFQSMKIRSLASEPVKIKVKPLPTVGMPKYFTGLVGAHEFKISINKNKFVVNEAIEVKMSVSGPGALENYEGPKLYFNSNLEEFETKYDLNLSANLLGEKDFEYTYLARGPVEFKESDFKFAYFDPVQAKYVTVTAILPALEVLGSASANSSNRLNARGSSDSPVTTKTNAQGVESGSQILAPVFKVYSLKGSWVKFLNILLIVLNLFLWLGVVMRPYILNRSPSKAKKLYGKIKKQGISYSNIHQFLHTLISDKERGQTFSLDYLLETSQLSAAAKSYFKELVDQCEKNAYTQESFGSRAKLNNKHFQEVIKLSTKV